MGIARLDLDRGGARAPIIAFKYALRRYFAGYAPSIRSLMAPSTGSRVTSFIMPAE
jgi:hypothetical protein